MSAAVTLLVDASLPAVRLLAAACHGVLTEWRVPEERRSLLELALVEAATNAVRHAYRDHEAGTVRVTLSREGDRLLLAVADRGASFDPASVPPPPEPDPTDPATWPEGGMGLALIRAACDEVTYTVVEGENVLTMHVRLPAAPRRT